MEGLRNSCAAMSRLLSPSLTSRAICASCGVSSVFGLGGPLAGAFAGGQQLDAGPFGEGLGAHRGEHLMRGAQLLARVAAAALAAQPFAVHQVGAGELGSRPGTAFRCSMASS